jgi:hypothetical protein
MTLREILNDSIITNIEIRDSENRMYYEYNHLELAEKLVKIADEFAIGFAEWLYKWDNTRLPNGNWIIKLGLKPYTSEEVLEIYKKENNL